MKPKPTRPRRAVAAGAVAFLLGAPAAQAAGFQINESSASGLGTAFASGAAAAEDASTLWGNVAGMARVRERQVVGAIHLVTPSMKFRNAGSLAATGQALGGEGGDAGGLNLVPNLYLAAPIDNRWSVGLGVTAPFGLVTEYESGWIGRFQAIKSSIRTVNLNPAVAWKPAGPLALGLGLNLQHIKATFTNQVNYSAALLGAAAQAGIAPGSATFAAIAQATARLESSARIDGSDYALGYNAGLLWDLGDDSRFGVHYRSSLKYRVSGLAQFAHPTPVAPAALAPTVAALAQAVNAGALADSAASAEVKLPAIVNLSYFTRLNSRWDVLADAQWTRWSTIQDLTFVRADGSVLQSTPENFRDSWKLALGVNWRAGGDWTLRGGVAADQSPVRTAYRTARLPDADRTWLAGGAQFRTSRALSLDVGAAYVRVKKATIFESGHPPDTALHGLIDGHYRSNTVIVSAQANYLF